MREIFAEQGRDTPRQRIVLEFCRINGDWLRPYAAFCVLRDINGTPDFSKWGNYAVYDAAMVEEFMAAHKVRISTLISTAGPS